MPLWHERNTVAVGVNYFIHPFQRSERESLLTFGIVFVLVNDKFPEVRV
jgi:hypothetical protein